MSRHVSIERKETLPEGLNFDALRLAGIRYAQELSGDIWTDYNEHDPGVTLLEHLCYALTDLSYRVGFDIEDVLFAREDGQKESVNNGFFPPVEILPTTPVTPTDYRRLLIDRVRGIRNAWFHPIESHNRGYRGLYRVRIQLLEGITDKQRKHKIVEEVRSLLMANRNLCEDLQEIVVLKVERLSLSASISIESDAFGEKVLANILHTLEQLLNPGIRYYSREELEAEGYAVEDIFDGPAPLHGFIKTDDLRPLPENTHVSTLREAIARVEGVKMIDNLIVWKEGQRILGDEILPSTDSALSLDPSLVDGNRTDGGVKLIRNGIPVTLNPRQTRQFLNTLSAKARKGFHTKLNLRQPQAISQKRRKDLSGYRSFQRLLPAVYGLGPDGLPATANRKRRAQAHQLKAYLLLFEQFMADYLAQLAHVRDLFSIAPKGAEDTLMNGHARTYYTNFPEDIPDAEDLFIHGLPEGTPRAKVLAKINEELRQLSVGFDPQDKRRNRFLDHMLARFGEVYTDDSLRFLEHHSREELDEALVRGKARFLSKYPELSRDRGKAFDYSQEAWETDNVAGLKKRVMLALDLGEPVKNADGKEFPRFANHILSPFDLLGNATLKNRPGGPAEPIHLSLLTMLRDGNKVGNYDIVKSGKNYVLLFRNKEDDRVILGYADAQELGGASEEDGYAERSRRTGAEEETVSEGLLYTGTLKQCTAARDRLVNRMRSINERGEGFFFLENILLRPKKKAESILVFESQLPEDGSTVVLRSLRYTDEKSLYNFSTDLLVIATHRANWSVLKHDQAWRVVLLDNGTPAMLSPALPSERAAQKTVDHLFDLCLGIRNNDPTSINNYLRLETERLAGFEVSPDFYSLRLSIIAPSWPAMYQNPDFHRLLHQTVAANIPAHLSVDYYWLDPMEMKAFEGLFRRWLEAKRGNRPNLTLNLSLELVRLLRPDLTEPGDNAAPQDIAHQKLPASLFRTLGTSLGYSFVFPTTDFSFVQGMPKAVAAALPELGFTDWLALRRVPIPELVASLQAEKLPASAALVRNWKKQVTLAINNRWKDLLRYQRKASKARKGSTTSFNRRTKLQLITRQLLQDPGQSIAGIVRWLRKLDNDQIVPYPVLNFLLTAIGNDIVLTENDLRIFSCIDEAKVKALNERGIYNWRHLKGMKARSWKSVLLETEDEGSFVALKDIQHEVELALTGNWSALNGLQKNLFPDAQATPLAIRIAFHTEQLMGPVASGERPLLTRLRAWSGTEKQFGVSSAISNGLLRVVGYQNLIPEDNFRFLEGIGTHAETALKKVGFTGWRQLARRTPEEVQEQLREELKPAQLKGARDWISQAALAMENRWEELIEWQKGPVEKAAKNPKKITALEAGINKWLVRNARDTNATTAG